MRKIFLYLTVFACFFLVACGDKYEKNGTIKETPTATATPTVTPSPTPTEAPKPKFLVCLDPGHGYKWEGAWYDRKEKDIVLDLAKEIRSYLYDKYPNIEVILTREDDNVLYPDDRDTDTKKRVDFAKEHGAQILVSLHMNASDGHNLRGSLVCISKQPNINAESVKIATALLNRTEALGLKNRGYQTQDSKLSFADDGTPLDAMLICRQGAADEIPAVILETLFMDNKEDYAFVSTEEAMKKLAAAIAEGIADYVKGRPEMQ